MTTGELGPVTRLTLSALLDRYLDESKYGRDGSLKTERYRQNCARVATYLKQWFGAKCPVDSLTPDRMSAYIRARRAGQVSGRPVRTRSVEFDLAVLKAALRWATGVFENGQPLLAQNPLASYSLPRERDPRPMLEPLMKLMDATGRRLGSVLGLRWDDIDFEQQTIRWRPELDKRRRTWVTPLPREVGPVLQRFRVDCPAIGNALLFPSPKDPAKPVSIYLARSWLLRAYERAGIKREPGGLWHPFRRKWATQRKEYPLRDVAAAGGWSDVQTLLTCYQQPDPETLRAVVDGKKLTQKLTQPKRQHKSHSS
jgi:integrase